MIDFHFRLRIFIGILIGVMGLGTAGFMFLEGLSPVDAFYFSIVTITTVGYGDIHPAGSAGKALAVILIICGVGTFLGVVANATEILMNRREKQNRLQKTNVVLGAFFSATGIRLIRMLFEFDPQSETFSKGLHLKGNWSKQEFSAAKNHVKNCGFKSDSRKGDLKSLGRFLEDKGDAFIRLLENPSLVEHESFTELLQASLHLRDELLLRNDLSGLPDSDLMHLSGDIQRVYGQLVMQWLNYMDYLKTSYPYLFNLAVRNNPFDPESSPVVE
jgi:hypothetical protein